MTIDLLFIQKSIRSSLPHLGEEICVDNHLHISFPQLNHFKGALHPLDDLNHFLWRASLRYPELDTKIMPLKLQKELISLAEQHFSSLTISSGWLELEALFEIKSEIDIENFICAISLVAKLDQLYSLSSTDVSTWESTPESMIESDFSLEAFIKTISQTFLMLDHHLKIVDLNDAFEDITGIRRDIFKGSLLKEASRDQDFSRFVEDLISHLKKEGSFITSHFEFGGRRYLFSVIKTHLVGRNLFLVLLNPENI